MKSKCIGFLLFLLFFCINSLGWAQDNQVQEKRLSPVADTFVSNSPRLTRIGTERDLTFTGRSTIADPKSNVLVQASADKEECGVVDIDIALARDKQITPKNHSFNDRRPAEYRLLVERAGSLPGVEPTRKQ